MINLMMRVEHNFLHEAWLHSEQDDPRGGPRPRTALRVSSMKPSAITLIAPPA